MTTNVLPRRRDVVLAGRITAFLGALHLVLTLAFNLQYLPAWFTGRLWFPANGLNELPPDVGAFWLTIGSFGLPLLLLGLLIGWLGRRDVTPPAFLAWTLGAWGTILALLFEPSPAILLWVPAVMLLVAARRQA
ncbi:DUF6463 family protein [Nonomuraea africana]|uniref:Uncharacterized protein n=1 Tax=Nonomuraea africana TaxID=46171 RepID=A0ABR9K5N3_9ACTN|nr:DUF6463 family protein [Nonomuraea africana]MBE1557316.1 hypothetical protein [Nonomuraea africana]